MSDAPIFTDSMHMRASMMTDFGASLILEDDDSKGLMTVNEEQVDEPKAPSEQRPKLTTTPSVAFRRGESIAVARVLERIDQSAAKRMHEGFNELNFALGVLNSFFIFYVWGRWPQHFWLLYFVETIILVPKRFLLMWRAKPLNEALYYLDLCWMLNFVGMATLIVFGLVDLTGLAMPEYVRKEVYLTALGAACGPLLGATIVLPFVSFVFHDLGTMTGLFIHILPPIVAYTFTWHSEEIRDAWPSLFALNYLEDVTFFPESGMFFLPGTGLGTVAGNAIALYFLWFVPYVLWMTTIGFDLPRTKRRTLLKDGKTPAPARFDTVFHSTLRGGLCVTMGSVFWGRPKSVSVKQMENNDFELRDFAVYMVVHGIMAVLSVYVLAYPCYSNKAVHVCFLACLTCICVYRGAKRYTYYSTVMYGRLIRKEFADIMNEDGEESSKKSK